MQSGLVFNIQRYSIHDGPGIRTTVFLKGCPLRCVWCQNPEGISRRREIVMLENRCIGCGECRRACRHATEDPGTGTLSVRLQQCELCGVCCQACPSEARRMMGEEMTVAQVLEAVLRDRVFFQDSGGGVTFSGGEPLMQPEFLKALLWGCRMQRLHTAVDTCGMIATEELLAVASLTDLFLFDLKLMEETAHARYTGASNNLILRNLRALGNVHSNIWVRVPLIPGINDTSAALEAAARFASSIRGVRQVNVLPFHATGVRKRERLGQSNSLPALHPPAPEALAGAIQIFEKAGLQARAGG
ncbi:MAG TPA: glycyl-radical enzyme activating protein [Verrucomicrobiae bacterium]